MLERCGLRAQGVSGAQEGKEAASGPERGYLEAAEHSDAVEKGWLVTSYSTMSLGFASTAIWVLQHRSQVLCVLLIRQSGSVRGTSVCPVASILERRAACCGLCSFVLAIFFFRSGLRAGSYSSCASFLSVASRMAL